MLSECDYIRKMLSKNYKGKVPSKAAKRWKMKGPYSVTYYQIKVLIASMHAFCYKHESCSGFPWFQWFLVY